MRKLTEIVYAFNVADEVAKGAPPRPQHSQAPPGFGQKIEQIGDGDSWGHRSPLRTSLCRCPMICRSRVSTRAEHPAALARSMSRSMKSRSRITYSWNQKGCPP